MKKIYFFILTVTMVVLFGVQTQAAELPFVPDGEEITSEIKEDKKEATEETKNEVTQETKEETTVTNHDSTDKSRDRNETNVKSDDIELPVEAVGDNTLTAVDDGIVIEKEEKVTVDKDKHPVRVDKDGSSVGKDVDGNVIEDESGGITETAAEEDNHGNKNYAWIILLVTGATAVLLYSSFRRFREYIKETGGF